MQSVFSKVSIYVILYFLEIYINLFCQILISDLFSWFIFYASILNFISDTIFWLLPQVFKDPSDYSNIIPKPSYFLILSKIPSSARLSLTFSNSPTPFSLSPSPSSPSTTKPTYQLYIIFIIFPFLISLLFFSLHLSYPISLLAPLNPLLLPGTTKLTHLIIFTSYLLFSLSSSLHLIIPSTPHHSHIYLYDYMKCSYTKIEWGLGSESRDPTLSK